MKTAPVEEITRIECGDLRLLLALAHAVNIRPDKDDAPRTSILPGSSKTHRAVTSYYDDHIVELAAQGKTQTEIARLLDCETSTVHRRGKVLGVTFKNGLHKPRVKGRDDQIRELAGQGKSVAEIASSTGYSDTVIYRRFRALGLKFPAPAYAPAMEAHVAAGRSVAEIARREGLSKQTIHGRLLKLGLPTTARDIAAYAAARRGQEAS